MLKNRDRNYAPKVKIYHEIREGVEVLYLKDEGTGWVEGLNEFGIGVVNSALQVARDEAEKRLVKEVGKKSKDGARILKVLEQKSLDEALAIACEYQGGVKGHTFLVSPDKTLSIEHTSKHDCVTKTVRGDQIHTRTNHGFAHENAGYTHDSDDYLSSVTRRNQAQKTLRGLKSPADIAPALYGKRKKDRADPNNMVRNTDNMITSSQMVLDSTAKEVLFYILPGDTEYLGYEADLPAGYKPKVVLKVFKYTELSEDGKFETKPFKKAASKLPIMDPLFNLREAAKQLLLLEDHLAHPAKFCPDCIRKHLLTAEAFLEEAVGLDKTGTLTEKLRPLPGVVRQLWTLYQNKAPSQQLGQQVRKLRKQLVIQSSAVRVASLSRFFTGYRALSAEPEDPQKPGHRFWEFQDCRVHTVIQPKQGRAHLVMIQLEDPRDCSGRGAGSTVLKEILRLADSTDTELSLIPAAVGSKNLSSAQLAAWYKRSGFTPQGSGIRRRWVRLPGGVAPSNKYQLLIRDSTGREESFEFFADDIQEARDHAWSMAHGWDVSTLAPKGFKEPEIVSFRSEGGRWRDINASAAFKSKKKVKTPDGVERVVYEYTEQHHDKQDKEKANRVEKIRQALPDLRSQYKRELTSDDPRERLTALAVALIDETYERVGNSESAKDGHFGVTGWLKKHVSFSGNTATIKYTGKSGVDQEKKISSAKVVSALKAALKGKKPDDQILCEGDDCVVGAEGVNAYLKDFGVTAKDLRGLHANEEMKARLKQVRSKGGTLPSDKKEREKILKAEFKEALEGAAEAVGHAPSMLRSSYLVPGLEEAFLKEGKPPQKLNKQGFVSAHRVAERYARVQFPKNKWIDVSTSDLERAEGETVWDLYSISYGQLGTHIPDLATFLSKYKILKLIDLDADQAPDAFIAYKVTPFGNKLALMGTDGTRAAKSAVVRQTMALIKQRGWYGEASHKVARMFESAGAPRITDEKVVRAVLKGKDIKWEGDGYYQRQLASLGMVQKALYGHPKVRGASVKTAAFDITSHCPHCMGILHDGAKFYDRCGDCPYEVNLGGFSKHWNDTPCEGLPCERMSKDEEWQPIPTEDPRLPIMEERAAKQKAWFAQSGWGSKTASQRLMFPASELKSGVGEYQAGWWRGFNPRSREAREWAKTVDFSEPVGVLVHRDGTVAFSDGHHRAMAGKILGRDIPIKITYSKLFPEVWAWYLGEIRKGRTLRQINPDGGYLDYVYQEQRRTAASNQDIIEAPHNHHPVEVEPPQAKRKEFPFEGYLDFQGIQIDVENKKGATRSGEAPDGTEWSIKMHAHYGEIRGTEGTDGDKLDVYVGDNHDSSVVVVIHQQDPGTGKFDEDKVMLGFDSPEEAIGLYKKQYDRPGFFKDGEFLTMPVGQFWRWVQEDRNKGKKMHASAFRVALRWASRDQGSINDPMFNESLRTLFSTKTRLEKEDEATEDLIKQSPTKKPPRTDLQTRKVKETDEEQDPDEKQDKKDRSQNYKDSSARRVALRFLAEETKKVRVRKKDTGQVTEVTEDTLRDRGSEYESLEEGDASEGDSPKDDGGKAEVPPKPDPSNLPGSDDDPDPKKFEDFQKSLMDRYLALGLAEDEIKGVTEGLSDKSDAEAAVELLEEEAEKAGAAKAEAEAKAKAEAEAKAKVKREKAESKAKTELIDNVVNVLSETSESTVSRAINDLKPEQYAVFKETLDAARTALAAAAPEDLAEFIKDAKQAQEDLEDTGDVGEKLHANPKKMAEFLAKVEHYEKVIDNPVVDADNPLSESGAPLTEGDLRKAQDVAVARAETAVAKYRQMDQDGRVRHLDKLAREMEDLKEGDPRRIEIEAIQRGLVVAGALEDGKDAQGVGSSMARLVGAADAGGNLRKILSIGTLGGDESLGSDDQAFIRDVYDDLTGSQFLGLVSDDHPAYPIAELLSDPEKNKNMSADDHAMMKEMMIDFLVMDTAFLDPATTRKVGPGAKVGEHDAEAKKTRAQVGKKQKEFPKDVKEQKSWVDTLLQALGKHIKKTPSKKTPAKPTSAPPPAEKKPAPQPSEKEVVEEEHAAGTVWKTDEGKYGAKNPAGDVDYFDDRAGADAHAQGPAKKVALTWDFAPWG